MKILNKNLSKQEKKDLFYIKRDELVDEIQKYYTTNVFSERLGGMIQKIAYGLSYATNYINYTYKEDMISDAINNMFKAIYKKNFDLNKAKCPECDNVFSIPPTDDEIYPEPYIMECPFCHKQILPTKFNPFSYLTQIASYAFINRIKIENKNNDSKLKYIQKIYDDIMIDNPYYYAYIKSLETDEQSNTDYE